MSTDRQQLLSSQQIAAYIRAKFRHTLSGDLAVFPFPRGWDITLLYECNLVAEVLSRAFRNPRQCFVLKMATSSQRESKY